MRLDIHSAGERLSKIAIVGTGISGLSSIAMPSQRHDVTLFQVCDRGGGHRDAIEFRTGSGPARADTCFVVFGDAIYPNLTSARIFREPPTAPVRSQIDVGGVL